MIASMTSRWCSTFGMVLPRTKPSMVTPTDHRSPPSTLKVVNVRRSMRPTPAMGLANVRTTGMKRAMTMVLGPYLAK